MDQTSSYIAQLPKLAGDRVPLDDNCPICFVPFAAILKQEENALTQIPGCGHIFCRADLIAWIGSKHGNCPTCRYQFLAINVPLSSGSIHDDDFDDFDSDFDDEDSDLHSYSSDLGAAWDDEEDIGSDEEDEMDMDEPDTFSHYDSDMDGSLLHFDPGALEFSPTTEPEVIAVRIIDNNIIDLTLDSDD
ncbi:hypothetical protein BD779DRAFT_1667466 [Infundibulicybe gibba]|nr:hypothetical protein BD779DRAFT_1667466 [Infundibulicybe gibba]